MLEPQIKPQNCEIFRLPTGKIYIGRSDQYQSVGFLELKPGMALDKHTRPVAENLKQIKGVSVVELYNQLNQITPVKLEPNAELMIPASQPHVHSNKSTQDSLTYWQFDGDITSIISQIRAQGIKV